jgi:hypothetical protein
MNLQAPELFLSNMTGNLAVQSISTIEYHNSYRALVMFAKQIEDSTSSDGLRNHGLLGLACAVYGWMPTILKTFDFERFGNAYPVAEIRGISSVSAGRSFLNGMNEIAPINGSWVGTSKLLHMLRPDMFPIWDRRVAVRFSLNHHYQVNSKRIYLEYFNFVHKILAGRPNFITGVQTYIRENHGYKPDEVRCLELILFAKQD